MAFLDLFYYKEKDKNGMFYGFNMEMHIILNIFINFLYFNKFNSPPIALSTLNNVCIWLNLLVGLGGKIIKSSNKEYRNHMFV